MAMAIDTVSPGSSPIHDIPVELLIRISDLLCTTDLCNLRLSCRAIEKRLYDRFVKEFFSCKQFMISHFSLRALVDISRSRLGPHLRRLQFGTDRVECPRNPSPQEMKLAKEAYTEQISFWSSGLHQDLLVEAFQNLSGHIDDVVLRDSNSRKRLRDDTEWRSYGASKLPRIYTMKPPADSDSRYSYVMQLYTTLLSALAKAKAQPRGIEFLFRRGISMPASAFHIPEFLAASWIPVLRGLQKCHLHIAFDAATPPPDGDVLHASLEGYHACQLLSHMTNLVELRINSMGVYRTGASDMLNWLAAASSLPAPSNPHEMLRYPDPVLLPNLTELSLGKVLIGGKVVTDLAKKFRALRSLELWHVTLLLQMGPNEKYHKVGSAWKRMLRNLVELPNLDDLRHLKIGFMSEESCGSDTAGLEAHDYAYYLMPVNPYRSVRFDDMDVASYTGDDWRRFVRGLISQIHTSTPEAEQSDADEEE